MTFGLDNLPRKDVLAHVVEANVEGSHNYYDDEINLVLDGVVPGEGGKLYNAYGNNTDGALTQRFASAKLQAIEAEIGGVNASLVALDTGEGVE